MFPVYPRIENVQRATWNSMSANAFNLNLTKILLFGTEFSDIFASSKESILKSYNNAPLYDVFIPKYSPYLLHQHKT